MIALWHNTRHALTLQVGDDKGLAEARPRTAYRLRPGEQVIFNLNSDLRDIRIISNAGVTPDALSDPTAGFIYKLHITVLDEADNVLSTHEQHHLGKIQWIQAADGTLHKKNRNFYLNRALEPTSNEDLYLLQHQLTQGHRLRLRFEPVDTRVKEVAVRVFEKMERPDDQALLTWRRMNYDERQRVARPHIYTASMLTEQDRQHLLRAFWKPMGPTGITDVDFRETTLYLIEEPLGRWALTPWQPEGWLISPDLWFSAPVIADTECHITLTPVDGHPQPATTDHVKFFFHNSAGQPTATHTVSLNADLVANAAPSDQNTATSNADVPTARTTHFTCPQGWLTARATPPHAHSGNHPGQRTGPHNHQHHGIPYTRDRITVCA